jgi:hypothetical protein
MSETLLARDLHQRHEPVPSLAFVQRLVGVFVAPVRTFTSFRRTPRWFGALAVSIALVSGSTFLFASSDIGARLSAERRIVFAEAAGHHVNTEEFAAMIASEQHGARLTAAIAGVWFVVFTMFVAAGGHALAHIALAYGSDMHRAEVYGADVHKATARDPNPLTSSPRSPNPFNRKPLSPNSLGAKSLGPDPAGPHTPGRNSPDAISPAATPLAATSLGTPSLGTNSLGTLRAPQPTSLRFRHALAIAAHASLISALAIPCRFLLNVSSGAGGPSTSIGVLLPFLPSDTIWAHLGNTIDLFGLWWAHTLAIGFALVYLRRPDGLRLLFIGIYLLVAVLLAATKVFAGAPSF